MRIPQVLLGGNASNAVPDRDYRLVKIFLYVWIGVLRVLGVKVLRSAN